MVRTESMGPGYWPDTSTVPAYQQPIPYRSVAPSLPYYEIDERLKLEKTNLDELFRTSGVKSENYIRASAAYENLKYIKDHGPQTRAQKAAKEITIDDIGNLLLDLTGYGSAIASLLPIPAARVGGMLGAGIVGSARYAAAGNYQRAAATLGNASRKYYNTMGRTKKRK